MTGKSAEGWRMRALRVVGLDEDGETVICEDPENGERFSVPADERLRAAARGDLTRLGQAQIEMEAQLRPREIQSRVRAGASVQQIVESSGLPEQRIERYAYPVLLERAQIAETAQRAHPVREDGPDVQTLGEIVAHTFGMRGHDYNEATWDSWRGDDNKWVVRLSWTAGKSDNSAHWVFHPGTQGGTVAALDEHAADLLDPSPTRALRTVRPVTELAREALELDHSDSEDEQDDDRSNAAPSPESAPERPSAVPSPHSSGSHSSSPHSSSQASPASSSPSQGTSSGGQRTPSIPTLDLDPSPNRVEAVPEPKSTSETRHSGDPEVETEKEQPTEQAEAAAEPAESDSAEEKPASGQRRGRKNHPIVPSWEDVLLGVRSHR